MNRIELIREIFQKSNFKNYLEIGCNEGKSFLPVKAKYKTAVDPYFIIPTKEKVKWLLKEPSNLNSKYFEEESDTFFLNRKSYLEKTGPLEVVLVDGLHTYRAALSDVLHSLEYLNKDGIIIMHDCFPPFKAASLPTKAFPTAEDVKGVEGWTGEWCGDVWKAVVYLRRNLSDLLDVCVLHTDFGLGIVRPKGDIDKKKLVIDERSFKEIDQLTYDELIKDPAGMLNLKKADHASTIIKEVTAGNPKR